MTPDDHSNLIRDWSATEAARRKADPRYELAQERAERAIYLMHDYEGGDMRAQSTKQTRRKK
jgi:hypothetical protein